MLELVEEASDEVALAVQVIGHRAPLPAVPLGRDVGARAMVGNAFEDGAGVAAAVGDGVPGRLKAGTAALSEAWPGVSAKRRGKAAAVDDDVDFGAQPASRPSDGVIRTPFFRPQRSGAQDVKNPVDRPPVVHPWNTPRLVRQQRRDDRSFRIRQIVPAPHSQAPAVWKIESHQSRKENPFSFMSARPRCNVVMPS